MPSTPEEAIAQFRSALRRHPADPGLRNRLGDWYLGQGQTAKAVAQFRTSAQCYLQEERHAQAVAVLKKAFRQAPLTPGLGDELVHACRLSGRPQAAAEVFFTLSRSLVEAGDAERAYQLFARGVAENSGNLQRAQRLALWSLQTGRRDRAADLYLDLAARCGDRLDLDRAYRFLAQARELRNGPKAALAEVRILAASGRQDQALELARSAKARFQPHEPLERWLATHGNGSQAPAQPRETLPGRASLARLRQHLQRAQSWLTQGYPGRALALIQRILLADPGFVPAIDLARQIHEASGVLSRYQRLCQACAQRLMQQGRKEETIAFLDRMDAAFPGSSTAYRAALGLPPAPRVQG